MFLFLKYKYTNSRLYAKNFKELPIHTGFSLKKSTKLIKRFLYLKWIEKCEKTNTYNFKKLRTLFLTDKSMPSDYIKFSMDELSVDNIIDEINFHLINNKKQQVDYIKSIISNYQNSKSRQKYEAAKRIVKKYRKCIPMLDKAVDTKFSISYLGLGKVLKTSQSSAFRSVRRLVAKKKIMYSNNTNVLFENGCNLQIEALKNTAKFRKAVLFLNDSNQVIEMKPNSYVLVSPKSKDLTLI